MKGAVVVTGGAGYIGSHAVIALVEAGWDVTVIDNLSTGHRQQVHPAARFVEGDIGNPALVAMLLAGQDYTAILHFAGSIIVPESVADPLKYYGNNTDNTRRLIAAALAASVPHFVFSSTATVYGTPDLVRIPEDAPLTPISPYGMSKYMSEVMLRDVAAAHPLSHAVLRYFNVAGADPKGRTGQSTPEATHLIKVAVQCALGLRPRVEVFGTDYPTADGTGERDYIHVSDLAAAHVAALDWLVAHPGESLTVNVGYGHGASVHEVLSAVRRVTRAPVEQRLSPRRAGDAPRLVSDNTRILSTLDWTPAHDDLDDIVASAFAWEKRLLAQAAPPAPKLAATVAA